MPYHISQRKRGYCVIETDTGIVITCHRTKEKALNHLRALWANKSYKVADKYAHIDFKPNEAMADEARRGLAWRREFKRGGLAEGVARARNISNRDNLSPDTIGRMVSFFARHEKSSKGGEGFRRGDKGYPSAGRIAWALWGGDAGKAWANKIKRQMDSADAKTKAILMAYQRIKHG